MSLPTILWIDLQPILHCINQRLIKILVKNRLIKYWSFQHDLDEACSIATIHELILETMRRENRKYHLIGHGISGTIAHLFANKYPETVHSTILLSVDTAITNQWTSHYLKMRNQFSCSRERILMHLSSCLFREKVSKNNLTMVSLLAKCLDQEYTIGSIASQYILGSIRIASVPTLVINGNDDFVVDRNANQRWVGQFKPGDHYRSIKNGRHFFHYEDPRQTSQIIESFLDMVPET
ncbi:alpha/beta hydrolase [Synechococcus sp. M16CYN]|uniref:alpha/beta fold hydrolase n=1 Tax=Synechococcus sp. M16CYN TaxID=3103139 RepID=UPI00324FFFE0